MKEKILKLREEGKSYNEIKKILGCSKGTISYHCTKIDNDKITKSINLDIKNKMQVKDVSFLLPAESIISSIIELRKKKRTYLEISNELDVSTDVIKKVCRKSGLCDYRKFGSISDDIIDKIKVLYSELKSTRKVAKIFGISRDSVRKYVNIEIKKRLTDEESKSNSVKSVVDWRKRTKIRLVDYKGGKCVKCGYNKSVKALEFHHLNPDEKDFTISGKSWSFERLKNEVDKCILVCSNCHIEIHEEIQNMKNKTYSTEPN